MAIDINKQQRKIYLPKIVFNVFLAVGFFLGAWFWVFESVYPTFNQRVLDVTAKAATLKDLENGNITSFNQLTALLGDATPLFLSTKQTEAMDLVRALRDPKGGFQKKLEAANADIEAQKEDISRQREVLGNIIPTLTSASSDEALEKSIPDKIDLKRLVQYMEDRFFRKLNIPDIGSIGLDGIKYDPLGRERYKIGTFSMSVPFKNAGSFQSLMDLFATTGIIPLKPEGGIDTSKAPSLSRLRGTLPGYSAISNPLITVDQLSIGGYFDSDKDKISGNVTVKLYLRTLSSDEMQVLGNKLYDLIRGVKDDITQPGLIQSLAKSVTDFDAAIKTLCDGAQRTQATCLLNNTQFVADLNSLRDLSKSATGLEAAVTSILSKKDGKSEVETTASLSDVYRRINAMDKRFKELDSILKTKLGLK